MLPKYFRFRVLNDTDQTLTYNNGARITVSWIPWKIASGVLSYGSEVSQAADFLDSGETLAADGEAEGAVKDNSSDLYWGLHGTFEVTADANSTDGTVYLYLETSTDNTVWPSDQADFEITDLIMVCALDLSTDAEDEDRAKNFSL